MEVFGNPIILQVIPRYLFRTIINEATYNVSYNTAVILRNANYKKLNGRL